MFCNTWIRSSYDSSIIILLPVTFFASTMVFKSASNCMCLDISVARTMSMTIFRRVFICFDVRWEKMFRSSAWRSLKATAKWWFSSTLSSLYIKARSLPRETEKQVRRVQNHPCVFFRLLVLIKNWFVTPGWSTSWMAEANMAAMISNSVKTPFDEEERERERIESFIVLRFLLFFSYIECWGIEQNMHWLTNVSSMSFIMIGNLLIMIFKCEQVGD